MRYEKYKDSGIEWIGAIPEHWEVKRIRQVANIFGRIGYRGYKTTDLVPKGEGAVTISPSNMKEYHMDFSECTYLSWEKYEESPEIMISNGDILFVKTGSTYGKTSFVDSLPEKATINPQIVVLKDIICDKKYLWYSLKSVFSSYQVETTVVGGTIPTISQDKIRNYSFISPTPQEQTSIATYLDRKTAEIDELIADKKRLLELYEEEKTAIINQAVTKGINPNAPMKDSGIEWLGEIPEHWEVKKIKWEHQTTSGGTPKTGNPANYDGNIPWLRTLDLNNDKVYDCDIKITEKAILESSAKVVPINSLLIAMYGGAGTIGKCGLLKFEAAINQALCAVMPNENTLPEFLLYFTLFFRPYWMVGAEGTRRDPNISQDDIKNKEFLFLPLEEQISIVNYIESEFYIINAKVKKTEKLVELLTEYRTALISEVVTGKIKVTE